MSTFPPPAVRWRTSLPLPRVTLVLTSAQLRRMRTKHPCLLEQAVGYGARYLPETDGAELNNLPPVVAENVQNAVSVLTSKR